MFQELKIERLFDLSESIAADLLSRYEYPWEVLPAIKDYIMELGEKLSTNEYERIGSDIWISKTAEVAASASIHGPVIIGKGACIRHCAFIRGSAVIGEEAVVGNSTELKNVILFNKVQVPHYNYVGDSILGYKAHMGAGSITSNVKSDKTLVTISLGGEKIPTGLKKMGAILGDQVEVGCNSVLNPGSIIGKNSSLYPLSMVRGYVPEESILKGHGEIVKKDQKI